jgi:hypothetical protein
MAGNATSVDEQFVRTLMIALISSSKEFALDTDSAVSIIQGFFVPRCSCTMENIATTVRALSALAPELGAATLENAAKLSLQREQLEQTNHEYVALAAENHRQILKLLNVVRGSVTVADAINVVDAIVVRVCELNFVPDRADASGAADLKREYEFLRNLYQIGDVRAAIDRRIEAIEQATAPEPEPEPEFEGELGLEAEPELEAELEAELEPELEPEQEFDPELPMAFEPTFEPGIGSAAVGFDDDAADW